MRYVLNRTDEAIAELEQRRADIDATLAELRVINETVRRGRPIAAEGPFSMALPNFPSV
jgi:hypothetical protein